MDAETLKAANRNRERRDDVEEALEYWRGVKSQDVPDFRLKLTYLPGNPKIAPDAARFTEAEMAPIRAAKIHALEMELVELDAAFEAISTPLAMKEHDISHRLPIETRIFLAVLSALDAVHQGDGHPHEYDLTPKDIVAVMDEWSEIDGFKPENDAYLKAATDGVMAWRLYYPAPST